MAVSSDNDDDSDLLEKVERIWREHAIGDHEGGNKQWTVNEKRSSEQMGKGGKRRKRI